MAETVTRIDKGVYRVVSDGAAAIVYVAGIPGNRWAFWNGHLFRDRDDGAAMSPDRNRTHEAARAIEAPMPATVIKLLVAVGDAVRKGDPLVLLEAMKMELPVRAPRD